MPLERRARTTTPSASSTPAIPGPGSSRPWPSCCGPSSSPSFSIAELAERAGVSAATIYRYFPNRAALVEALDEWLTAQLVQPRLPETATELPSCAARLFQYYADHAELFRIARTTSAMREVHDFGQQRRDRGFVAKLAPLTDHLEPRRATAIHALLRVVFGFDVYEQMHARFGVDAEAAGAAVAWASQLLLDGLARERASRGRATRKAARPTAQPRSEGSR